MRAALDNPAADDLQGQRTEGAGVVASMSRLDGLELESDRSSPLSMTGALASRLEHPESFLVSHRSLGSLTRASYEQGPHSFHSNPMSIESPYHTSKIGKRPAHNAIDPGPGQWRAMFHHASTRVEEGFMLTSVRRV